MKLQLVVFSLLIQVSFAEMLQTVTVLKGSDVDLHCPIIKAHQGYVEWKDPDNKIMFFNSYSVIRDKRYSITKLSDSQFSISISKVTFKDGGIYTCTQYGPTLTEKRVKITVLDGPRMSVTKHEEMSVVKCISKANNHLPTITWKIGNGSEFQFVPSTTYKEHRTFVASATLNVLHKQSRVTVMCLVHHPDLHDGPLINFVKVGKNKPNGSSTPSSFTEQPTLASSTDGSPAERSTTTNINGPSLEWSSSATASPEQTATYTHRELSPSDGLLTSTLPDQIWNDNSTESANTTGDLIEDITVYNTTERNMTDSLDSNRRTGTKQNSSLLVLLVTCLIFGLLVVVIFFAIKLRRAHIAWKRENEDSDPSEASSKSKSSQEEKNSQGQRRRGLFNTVFAHYVVEDPTAITSVTNSNAVTPTETVTTRQTSQDTMPTAVRSEIKETSL